MTAPGSEATPVEATSAYAVKVPVFEGPLDLLLHLIRLNEVEITDIPVAQISEQYIEYLDLMRDLNLDVAGEYLLMAATLAWIKSRMLLPSDAADEEGEIGDPRAELVARLLEYQRFKEASEELGDRSLLGRDVFAARGPELEPPPESEREIQVGLFELVEALRRALRTAHSGKAHEIEVETVTVRDRMLVVMQVLATREAVDFEALLAGPDGGPSSREILVATFLAILELTRLEALRVYQGQNALCTPVGPIHVRRAIEPGDASWTERISDLM